MTGSPAVPPAVDRPADDRTTDRRERAAGAGRAFGAVKAQHAARRTGLQRLADGLTRVASSPGFLVLHVVWFVAWIVANAGTAGMEPSFAVIILGGRVFGRGFGFVLGAVTIFVGALLTGGVGPWLPVQMVAAGWVGFFAGCLPPARGRAEVVVLAAYAAAVGLAFGVVMNLWFWPFASYGPEVSYVAGAALVENLRHYAVFYVTTSMAWDLGRSLVSLLVIGLAGRPLLRALRRAARRAAFDAPVSFERAGSA